MNRQQRQSMISFATAFLLVAIAVATLLTAAGYSRSSGLFPFFIGWIFLALALLESLLMLRELLRVRRSLPADDYEPDAAPAGLWKQSGGFLWLAVFLLLLWLAGFLIATPMFIFAFLRLSARRTLAQAVLVSGVATIFEYVVFVWLLEYRLYSGILFGD